MTFYVVMRALSGEMTCELRPKWAKGSMEDKHRTIRAQGQPHVAHSQAGAWHVGKTAASRYVSKDRVGEVRTRESWRQRQKSPFTQSYSVK